MSETPESMGVMDEAGPVAEHEEQAASSGDEPDREEVREAGRPLERADARPVEIAAGRDAEPVVVDWSGEGRPDLLVSVAGGPAGRLAWLYRALERAGDGLWTYAEAEPIEALAGLRAFCLLPASRPGRFDLVALDAAGLLVRLIDSHESGAPEFGPAIRIMDLDNFLPPGARVAQLLSEDWDGDGNVDLLAGIDDLEGYWPDSPGVPVEQQVGRDEAGRHAGCDPAGRWRGAPPRGRLFWLRNVGPPGEPLFEPPQEVEAAASGRAGVGLHPAFLAVPWGRSRSPELLLTDRTGQVRLHRNFGGQRPPVLMEPRPIRLGDQPLRLPKERTVVVGTDLDGDGRTELLFGQWDGRLFAVRSGAGRDEAREPEPLRTVGRTLRLGGGSVIAAGDLDGDGDVDLIAGDGPGRLWLIEDVGTAGNHQYAEPVELEAGGLPWKLETGVADRLHGPIDRPLGFAAPTIADWKHSDRPDLVVSGADGRVVYLRNNGGPTQPRFDRPEAIRTEGRRLVIPPRVRPAVAHWNEAVEWPDVIALDDQGFLCVYPRTEIMDVGPPDPLLDPLGRLIRLDGGFGLAGRCTLWAGPWTAPGRVDLLVGLPRSARFVVPALLGLDSAATDDLPTVLLLENLGKGTVRPRAVRRRDGVPLVVGDEGCSPCGVDWRGDGLLDLLVGSDDGRVLHFPREALAW